MMRRSLLSILLLQLSLIVLGSNFKHLSTIDGLSQNDVNCIFQDHKGFMWFGTNDGLNRYDGYSIKVFRKEPRQENGLASNLISSVTEDKDGRLWLGTSDNGFCMFNVATNEVVSYKNSMEQPDLLPSNRIFKVMADSHSNIWVLTHSGLCVLNIETNQIKWIKSPVKVNKQGNFCKAIHEDPEGIIWLGSYSGLMTIDPVDYRIEFDRNIKSQPYNVSDIVDFGNYLIVRSVSNIFHYDKVTGKRKRLAKIPKGADVEVDNEGSVWAGTGVGVQKLRIKKQQPLTYQIESVFKSNLEYGSLSNNIISDLYKDRTGLIWVGTIGGGVNIINPERDAFKHIKKSKNKGSLSENNIRSVLEDSKGNLWVGTDGGGLNFLPSWKEANLKKDFEHIVIEQEGTSNRTYSIAEDTDNGFVFVGTGHNSKFKVFKASKGSKRLIYDGKETEIGSVFTILVDQDKYIWMGTYGNGLWRIKFDGKGISEEQQFKMNVEESYRLPSDFIRSLTQDKNGNIWVGTTDGLSKIPFEEKNKTEPNIYTYINIPNDSSSISHNYILPLYVTKKGDVWIGTMGGGLNRYCEDEQGVGYFESYTTKEGLPNNVIKGILEDDSGNLWISSNRGLSQFDVETKKFQNFGVGDGLQDYEFAELACAKAKGGELMFGGVNGLNIFNPYDIKKDKSESTVAFTQLDILNQQVSIGEEVQGRVLLEKDIDEQERLTLKYAENSFSVYFSGLHYAAPQKNKFQYMLEGFDEDWVPTTADARFAKYTNLGPGKYSLKVKASNADGIWSKNVRTLNITVVAPWYMSNVAMIMYVVVIVVLLVFFRRFSVIEIQQKDQLQRAQFEKEKAEELSQMKLRFFTNISHEFRTPLTLILGPIEKLIKEKASLSESRVDKIHQTIYRNTNVLLRLINQLMDFRKFEQGKMELKASESDVVGFVNDVYSSFEIVADQKQIDYQFDKPSHSVLLCFDPEKLEKIVFNLLSNAFKYTQSNDSIKLKLIEEANQVTISVEDTGIGMSKQTQEHVFERYFNAGTIDNIQQGSTGIGLSFTKNLVEMHHGSISVISDEGVGTTFTVVLPKGKAHFNNNEIVDASDYQVENDVVILTPSLNHDVKQVEEEGAEPQADKLKVLIVEDNTELRSFVAESLSTYYNVIQAENGEEGLAFCKDESPDLIISDVMMPKMDGFEMCKTIKEDVNISHIPIVLLTAKTSGEHKVKGYELGADAYVAKPFEFDVLKAQIENLLKKRRQKVQDFDKKIDVSPSEIATTSADEKFIAKIVSIIESNMDNSEFTVEELASDYGISKVILNRKLKALTDKTAKIFIRSIRLKRAAQLLTLGRYTVAEVTYEVGFSDLKYFRTCFKNEFSISPSDYKKQHSGQEE